MKNLFSQMMEEGGKNPARLDYDTCMEMAIMIAANFVASIKSNPNLDSFLKDLDASLRSKTKLAEVAIAINLPTLEVGKPYTAGQFSAIVEKYFDGSTPTQRARALTDLTRLFRFDNVTGKKSLKKFRMKFEGRPSAYLLSSKLASMKRVYENKSLVEKILFKLRESGILHLYLMNRILIILYMIKKDTENRYMQTLISYFPYLVSNTDVWHTFRNILIGINATQLEEFANRICKVIEEKITETPTIGQLLLVFGFSRPESIKE